MESNGDRWEDENEKNGERRSSWGFYRAQQGFGAQLTVGDGRDASEMDALLWGANLFEAAANRHRRISLTMWQSTETRWWSSLAAGDVEFAGVLASMQRKKKASSFSSRGPQLPVTYRIGMRLGLAAGPARRASVW
jgi:hypothetical protein